MLNLKNTLDGYLKNVEVIGNTIQDTNNLANIRSVGDKVEGQELYKIDLVSRGKNLFDGSISRYDARVSTTNGYNYECAGYSTTNYIKVKGNTPYTVHTGQKYYYAVYDKDKKHIGGNIASSTIWLSENVEYIRFDFVSSNINIVQIEEGTVATPYEPYKENKLEILSSVQLEKVGDIADRIICKDGVWGVEKNINVLTLNGQERVALYLGGSDNRKFTEVYQIENINYSELGIIRNGDSSLERLISNKFTGKYYCWDLDTPNRMSFHPSINNIYFSVDKTIDTVDKFREHISGTIIKFPTSHSQFIPLPYDQQVKLRTFAGQTNISFLTEIPGQIKAQVPKSLGATVNTHTEQIAKLHNSLDRVKKLEETTVSTVETESNFTTVNETSNGYFEDVKLEGRTLVNLFKNVNWIDNTTSYIYTENVLYNPVGETVTFINLSNKQIEFAMNDSDILGTNGNYIGSIYIGAFSTKVIKIPSGCGIRRIVAKYQDGWIADDITTIKNKTLLLKGAYPNIDVSYFEGLMSVGQDVEEINVGSVNENLFDKSKYLEFDTKADTLLGRRIVPIKVKPNCTYTFSVDALAELTGVSNTYIWLSSTKSLDSGTFLKLYPQSDILQRTVTSNSVGELYLAYTGQQYYSDVMSKLVGIQIEEGIQSTLYKPHKSNKKSLLYYNPTTETWEKPVLREWDTIEKHSDGKYYYHKRSGEVALNGSESWNVGAEQATTIRYQLSLNTIKPQSNLICDKFAQILGGTDSEGISNHFSSNMLQLTLNKDKGSVKQWLKANPTTVVYQLAQEEVYECTNIDLMTYSGETNYIINSGAISPKSLLKVHNNISNVVKILQEKVSLLENTFIAGLKSVLSGDMYSLATILYPEDFEQNDNTEQDIMVIPE